MAIRTAAYVFDRMRPLKEPFVSYEHSLRAIAVLPPGYGLCYAFHYAEADTGNGGFEQLHHNETWRLVPTAITACEAAGAHDLARLFREVVRHYHEVGECEVEESLCAAIRAPLATTPKRTLAAMESEFFAVEAERYSVVQRLVAISDVALWGEDDPPIVPRELTADETMRRAMIEQFRRELAEEYKDERPE
jgi:Domain of unknown function (DUF4375)